MNQATGMGYRQSRSRLSSDHEDILNRHRPLTLKAGSERLAGEEGHDKIRDALLLAD